MKLGTSGISGLFVFSSALKTADGKTRSNDKIIKEIFFMISSFSGGYSRTWKSK